MEKNMFRVPELLNVFNDMSILTVHICVLRDNCNFMIIRQRAEREQNALRINWVLVLFLEGCIIIINLSQRVKINAITCHDYWY